MNAIMDQSIITATNVFQTAREIVVNNNFGPSPKDPLSWVNTFAAASIESVVIFDDRMRLLKFNNRYGTLDAANQRDLADLYSLFRYYGKFYRNADHSLQIVKQVFMFHIPREFIMHNYSGWTCDCRAYPVLDGMQLGGVVLLAHRNGSAPPIGEGNREQSAE